MSFSGGALLQGAVQVAFPDFWPDLVEKNKSLTGQIPGLQGISKPQGIKMSQKLTIFLLSGWMDAVIEGKSNKIGIKWKFTLKYWCQHP